MRIESTKPALSKGTYEALVMASQIKDKPPVPMGA